MWSPERGLKLRPQTHGQTAKKGRTWAPGVPLCRAERAGKRLAPGDLHSAGLGGGELGVGDWRCPLYRWMGGGL